MRDVFLIFLMGSCRLHAAFNPMQRLYTFLIGTNILINFSRLYDYPPNFKVHFKQLYGHMTEIIGIKTNFLFYTGRPPVSRREAERACHFGVKTNRIIRRQCR